MKKRVMSLKLGMLEIIVFTSGMSVMVVEIGGARLIAPYLGNTLFTWTSAIAVILAALGLGYYLGGVIADKKPEIRILSVFIFAAAIFIGATPYFSGGVLELSYYFLGYKYGPLFACTLLFAIPNVFLGMITPCAVRLKARNIKIVGKSAGNLYAISTTGSIVGALITGYFLIPDIGINECFFVISALLIIVGILIFGKKSAFFLIIVLPFILIPPSKITPSMGKVIYATDTPYYHLQVDNLSGVLYLQTDLSFQSAMSLNSTDIYNYYKYQPLLYTNSSTEKALYLGLGGGMMAQDLYAQTNASIDIVEIDPVVIEVAHRFFGLSNDTRIQIYNQDARPFLRNAAKTYDMIVLDAYGSSTSMPYQLTTVEAATEMKAHLTDNGSVFINIISPLEGNSSCVFKSLYKTFSSVFPHLYVFPDYPENSTKSQNIVLIASEKNYSKTFIINNLNGKIGKSQMDWIVSDSYQKSFNMTECSILTDDKNPMDNYAASVLSSLT